MQSILDQVKMEMVSLAMIRMNRSVERIDDSRFFIDSDGPRMCRG